MKALLLVASLLVFAQARDRNFEREGEGDRRKDLDAMEGKPAPEIEVDRWLKGEPATLKTLRGKVVLLDFWGTW